jgi:hypothetical protein
VKGIQVCSIKEPGPFEKGDNHKNDKMDGLFKHFLLQNYEAIKDEFYKKDLEPRQVRG